ncbi:MAG TPA: cysteine--tRNA ligase [Candidatus Eremiobacteraceae bacterium]|nr:cysteine--tRNA ligase [Candidatus Eremiobacteraceae bacterium]
MALRLYNSLTRSVEPFEPRTSGSAGIYVCGMTPSFHPHLGHARTFLTFDVLRRHLRNRGYKVTYVQNVTDIEDKIIERAAAENVPWQQIVDRYYGEYKKCAEILGIEPPDVEPYATREMADIVDIIAALVARDDAYETGDGVYFSVQSFPRYSELSNRDLEELRAGARVAKREDKRDPMDFALWKKAKPGEPSWPSQWGPGRPGWHIECSVMARRYLGDQFDIHGGATDLIFPHHENEVAQTESVTGKHPMARYWMHAGLMMVDGQKMSKSLGNFTPLTDMLEKYEPAAIRFLFLQTGYRKPTNFTEEAIGAATEGLRRLYDNVDALRTAASTTALGRDGSGLLPDLATDEFDAFLDDDLNTAGALGWLVRRIRDERAAAMRGEGSPAAAAALAERCLRALGLPAVMRSRADKGLSGEARELLTAIVSDGASSVTDAELIDAVIALRDQARAAKDFKKSDELRAELTKAGVSIKDGKAGTEWSLDGST